jgi:hypothetical protein
MSPIQSNTTQGLVTYPAASDLSASIGCFAKIGTDGNVSLPSANGFANFIIEDAYSTGGAVTPPSATLSGSAYECVLRPLDPARNMRVVVAAGVTIASPGVQIATNGSGKAYPASTGGYVLGVAEESAVAGQYVLMRPNGGIYVSIGAAATI